MTAACLSSTFPTSPRGASVTPKDDPTAQAAADAENKLLTLQVEISTNLQEIAREADRVTALHDTHQRGIGFLTPTARAMIGKQWVRDREDRREADRLGQAHGTGPVATPGNFAGIAVDVEVWTILRDQIRKAQKSLTAAGNGRPLVAGENTTVHQLTGVLLDLMWDLTDTKVLRLMSADTEYALELVTNLVHGNSREALDDPCPHCGRKTLVAYFKKDGADEVRCDRDPVTKEFEKCLCRVALCECQAAPKRFRHTWYRPRPGTQPDSWTALRRAIADDRTQRKQAETEAAQQATQQAQQETEQKEAQRDTTS